MMNVNNVNELKEILNEESLKGYVEFTIMNDEMNFFSVFKSMNIVCCDVISDDEIINNYYHKSVDEMISQIVECMKEYDYSYSFNVN